MRDFQRLDRFSVPPNFRGRRAWVVQLWWLVEATLFSPSPQIFYGWRRMLLRLFGAHVGQGVLLRPSVRVTYPWKVSIGDYSWIGDNVVLYSLGDISIEDHCVVSQGSYLCAGGHDYTALAFDIYGRSIRIKSQAWLASNVFVAPGVTIGRGTVIGARSSVFQDMPDAMLCVGTPAKAVKSRVT